MVISSAEMPTGPVVSKLCMLGTEGGELTHVVNLLLEGHPVRARYFQVVHAEKGGEEAKGKLRDTVLVDLRSGALERGGVVESLTKKMVTTVKAMIARPCLTLSSARFRAARASTILACCCLRESSSWSCEREIGQLRNFSTQ